MSNTVEYKGNIYEIGKGYLFGDVISNPYFYGKLQGIESDGTFITVENSYFIFCEELPASKELGAITKAPIKLVDGAAYQFDYDDKISGMYNAVMKYQKSNNSFYFDNILFKVEYCTNIIKLVPEVKV